MMGVRVGAVRASLVQGIPRWTHSGYPGAPMRGSSEAGWPGVQLYDVSQELGEQYERDYGLTLEMFLDLRHECSKYAATYPTLDPGYRDELLAKRRAHYMKVGRDWIAANPELVVPVEHHEGDNHPHEDSVIEACLEFDDPEACAREERVTLP